jgi:outer membrane receptor for ferric coprogen and ferric-rhodotorulic acid
MKGVLRIAVACAFLFGSIAGAADEPAHYPLKIAPQSLSTALQEFAKQSGIQIIFFSRIAEGREARALEGSYTLAAALEYLLAGSDLTFDVINDRAVEIRPAPAVADARHQAGQKTAKKNQRVPVAVPGTLEEVVVVGLAEQLVATRVPTPLRDIPQTISIVSPEQLRQQNATDLADVLRRAPGITTTRTSSLNQDFYSRGYEIASFHVDGGAALNPAVDPSLLPLTALDLSEFDHVEVLRGSDALFGGNGNPGGTVSLVRKRPGASFEVSMSAAAGSWNNYRVEADITGPLAADGALRGRLDGVYRLEDYL